MDNNYLSYLINLKNELVDLPEKSYPQDPWPQVEAWIAKARPFFRIRIQAYFPDFETVTAEPQWPRLAGIVSESFSREKWKARKTTTDNAVCKILSFVDSVIEIQHDPISIKSDTVTSLTNLLEHFPDFVRQLSNRDRERVALQVEDEYDVQYLLHALLRLYFDDIRAEEWTPSYAGGTSRIDFLIKNERLVIEAKMTRQGLGHKRIGEQLLIDIGRYRSHPDCNTLICFIYDPEYRISNPSGLQNDLEANSYPGLHVRIVIAPK